MIIQRGEIGIPCEIVRDAQTEFADDGGRVAAAVIVAGYCKVGGGGLPGAGVVEAVFVGPFEVAVVVVSGEDMVREVFVWVAGAPFLVLFGLSVSTCYSSTN